VQRAAPTPPEGRTNSRSACGCSARRGRRGDAHHVRGCACAACGPRLRGGTGAASAGRGGAGGRPPPSRDASLQQERRSALGRPTALAWRSASAASSRGRQRTPRREAGTLARRAQQRSAQRRAARARASAREVKGRRPICRDVLSPLGSAARRRTVDMLSQAAALSAVARGSSVAGAPASAALASTLPRRRRPPAGRSAPASGASAARANTPRCSGSGGAPRRGGRAPAISAAVAQQRPGVAARRLGLGAACK
jgi:hypothetical protein